MPLSEDTRRQQEMYYTGGYSSEFIRTLWLLGLISQKTFWDVGYLAGLSAKEIARKLGNKL